MAFQQGLSGLNSSAKALDVISNNVANSGTVGFKAANSHFADVFAASLTGSGASQIGIGASMATVFQQFTQGNITTTNNPLDISINGGGFFRMSQSGATTYTRNGQFHMDRNGYIVNDGNLRLTGYQADAAGLIVPTTPVEIQLDSADQPPVATGAGIGAFTGVRGNINLDSRQDVPVRTWSSGLGVPGALAAWDAPEVGDVSWSPAQNTYSHSITRSFNDSNGAAHTVSYYFVETATDGVYDVYANIDGTAAMLDPTNGNVIPPGSPSVAGQVTFDAAGQYVSSTLDPSFSVNLDDIDTALGTNNYLAGTVAVTQNFSTMASPVDTALFTPDPSTYNYSTALSIYDTLGNAHTLTYYFVKTATAGEWDVYASVDGTTNQTVDLGNGPGNPATLQFNSSGVLQTTMPLTINIDLNGVLMAGGSTNNAGTPLSFEMDFTGSTQFGSSFGTNRLEQDGYSSGRLTGLAVGPDGVIQGRYSNGQSRNLAQIVLANFSNPNGLINLGGNQWSESAVSGPATVGAPSTGSLGALQSSAVEESNVDLTAELVAMITQQRNYQANAQSIKTQDSIMQTIVNLR